ncbi:MAG: gliding motility-associated C-terminal domain-containing protein [Bacteroidetes bacterium]|nr:gliding motility-associated C-terminal domain-containing protein [Bacteroidota bacterium]
MKLPGKFLIALVAGCIFMYPGIYAACTTTISAFPYAEDFETGAGGWTAGGTNNDWALGIPSKPIINAAASGSNCWITGGLTTSFYQYGERSWVESPCFDFSLMDFPVVSFQIFWETENQYDGGNFQYSLNGGTTWVNVGTTNEPTDCFTQNWFNQNSVTNLNSLVTVNKGWSGTTLPSSGSCVGGNGSGEWKLAKHCMKNLAHEQQVIFRFTFGSGMLCNDYDGLAFDDFRITEADRTIPAFTLNCISSNEVSFTDASSVCPETWNWVFGDGGTSVQQSPTHTFVTPGIYQVKLITGNGCSLPDTASETITIIEAIVSSTDESCAGIADGTATATVNPAGTYNYSWNTVPVQTGTTATNLSTGTYTVTITGTDVCSASGTAEVLLSNVPFNPATAEIATSCAGAADGIAILQTVNSTLYTYSWNTVPAQTTDTAFNLTAGTYTVTVSGPGICAPIDFTVDVPDGNAGTPENILGSDTSLCTGNVITLQAGIFSAYLWENGSDSSFLTVDRPGYYAVEVTTTAGCKGKDSIYVEEKCLDDILFPSSFTPDNDGKNEVFYSYGIGVISFNMKIFDRWGELIFESDDIAAGWDGTFASHAVHDGIYLCVVRYSMDRNNYKTKKGKVVLIR